MSVAEKYGKALEEICQLLDINTRRPDWDPVDAVDGVKTLLASLEATGVMLIACGTHGKVVWKGEVICAKEHGGCGRVWCLADEDHPLHPPDELGTNCACGKSFMVQDDGPARAICPMCFTKLAGSPQAH